MSIETTAAPVSNSVVMISSAKFVGGCAFAALALFIAGRFVEIPRWLLAAEVFTTILGLFVFGSFKYQIHKNAITYGMGLVVIATFCGIPYSEFHRQIAESGWWFWAQENMLSFHGLDKLVHADTMLFILGLTFFVSVIAQTRLLEQITFFLLERSRGNVVATTVAVTAVVAFASGILDGVSMIGLTIRTLVIILFLAAASTNAVRYAVMVCTCVTTVCGIWLAYGEPPNLIMKANLFPHLTDKFFLRYCAPAAVASYLVIAWNLRRRLGGKHVNMADLDILDCHVATVRFMQAQRHGKVLTPIEFIEEHEQELGAHFHPMLERLHNGESMGEALVREQVPQPTREKLLGKFVEEELAAPLDRHYQALAADRSDQTAHENAAVNEAIARLQRRRLIAARIGAFALLPFVACLIWHGMNHEVPLFLASFAGFAVAIVGILNIPMMRKLALQEARHEYAEYYFLFPLFLSITLLTNVGFFEQLQDMLHHGIEHAGPAIMAVAQFFGCTVFSAILDNNVVADFASRALHQLQIGLLHLFAMSQIAGYAVGGCWTHIGSAQAVVAFAFIRRDIDKTYTPIQWIKEMTPVIIEICVLLLVVIYAEGLILKFFPEHGLAP